MRFHNMLLALSLLMMLWPGSHASAQTEEWHDDLIALNDPGLTAVYEAGLLTPLSASQTKDDFTVTLLWGYADAARINIGVRIDISDALVQRMAEMPEDNQDSTVFVGDTMVVDKDGNTYLLDQGSGGVMKAGETGGVYAINYRMDSFHNLSDVLDLTFVGSVGMTSVSDAVMQEMKNIGGENPFSFDIKVIYQGGYSLAGRDREEPLQPVTDANIQVSLTTFTVAPSLVQLEYCMEIPYALGGNDYAWGLAYTLTLDGEEDVVTTPRGEGGGGGGSGSGQPITQCNSTEFYVMNTDKLTGDWSIKFKTASGYRWGPRPPDLEKQLLDDVPYEELKPQLIESGYMIEVEGDWSFTVHFEDPTHKRGS